jgi:hypothetical protein
LDAEIVPEFNEYVLQFDPESNDAEGTSIIDNYWGTTEIRYENGDLILAAPNSRTTIEYWLAKEVAELIHNFFEGNSEC